MKNIKYVLVLIMTLTLSQQTLAECNNQETSGGEILGTLAGAAIGGLVGSQFGGGTGNKVAIGAGVVAGGFSGQQNWEINELSGSAIPPGDHSKYTGDETYRYNLNLDKSGYWSFR